MANSFPYCTLDDVKSVLLGLDVSDIPTTLETKITDRYIKWAQRDVDTFCGTNLDATVTTEFYNGTGTNYMVLRHKPVREILNVVLYIIPSTQWFQFKRWFYVTTTNQLGIKVARAGGVEPRIDPSTNQDFIPAFEPPGFTFDEAENFGFQNETGVALDITADFKNNEDQYGRTDLFINASNGMITIPPRILFIEAQAVPFWNYTWLRGQQNVRVDYVYGYSDPTQPDELTGAPNGSLPPEVTQACASLAAKYVLIDKGIFMGSGAKSISMDGVSKQYGETPYGGLIKYLDNQSRQLLRSYKQPRV